MQAQEIVFTFAATRDAIEGDKALADAGMSVRTMPRPLALGDGCGICLRVDAEKREQAEFVLRASGVRVEAVFLKVRNDGKTVFIPSPSGATLL